MEMFIVFSCSSKSTTKSKEKVEWNMIIRWKSAFYYIRIILESAIPFDICGYESTINMTSRCFGVLWDSELYITDP